MLFGGVKQIIKIEGMKCQHCACHAEEALKNIEGVKSAHVSLESKKAVIKSKSGINEGRIKKAIEEVGYKVEEVK